MIDESIKKAFEEEGFFFLKNNTVNLKGKEVYSFFNPSKGKIASVVFDEPNSFIKSVYEKAVSERE